MKKCKKLVTNNWFVQFFDRFMDDYMLQSKIVTMKEQVDEAIKIVDNIFRD